MDKAISYIHILFYAPLLFYVGYTQFNVPDFVMYLLYTLVSLAFFKHLFNLIQGISWVYLLHLSFLPLLMYIAYKKIKIASSVLIAIGLYAIYFHSKKIFS